MWEPKTTTVRGTHNTKTLTLDELLGAPWVHEICIQEQNHIPKMEFVALKTKETGSKRKEKDVSSKALKV